MARLPQKLRGSTVINKITSLRIVLRSLTILNQNNHSCALCALGLPFHRESQNGELSACLQMQQSTLILYNFMAILKEREETT